MAPVAAAAVAAAGRSGQPSLPPPPVGPALAQPPAPIVSASPAFARGTGRPLPSLAATGARDVVADFPLDGPRTLVGFLVSYENVEIGQYWPIHQGRNVLGRQGAATGLDVEISHPTTSSLHAVLLAAAQPGRVVVEDTNSTNGTFVNDNILAPGQRWELRDGDRVRFGLFDTVIKIVNRA
jgi:FHA domain